MLLVIAEYAVGLAIGYLIVAAVRTYQFKRPTKPFPALADSIRRRLGL